MLETWMRGDDPRGDPRASKAAIHNVSAIVQKRTPNCIVAGVLATRAVIAVILPDLCGGPEATPVPTATGREPLRGGNNFGVSHAQIDVIKGS
jgi:hypothetical protein